MIINLKGLKLSDKTHLSFSEEWFLC